MGRQGRHVAIWDRAGLNAEAPKPPFGSANFIRSENDCITFGARHALAYEPKKSTNDSQTASKKAFGSKKRLG
jgi:hypothetical protein